MLIRMPRIAGSLGLLFTFSLAACHDSTERNKTDAFSVADTAADDAPTRPPTDAAVSRDTPPSDLSSSRDVAADNPANVDIADGPIERTIVPDLESILDVGIVTTTSAEVGLAVWGSSPNDIWIGGKGGMLRHWNGSAWKDYPFFSATCLVVSIWGSSPTSVWAAGCTNTVAHWDGIQWQEQATPAGNRLLETMAGSADDDIWIGGCSGMLLRWDGHSWSDVSVVMLCHEAFWFNGRSDGWLVSINGSASGISRWNGQQWTEMDMTGIGEGRPTSLFATAIDDVWVGTWNGLYHFDGTQWGIPSAGTDIGKDRSSVFALWGRSSLDMYAGTTQGSHFDGTSWSSLPLAPGSVRGIWGEAVGETWFVGDNGFLGRVTN